MTMEWSPQQLDALQKVSNWYHRDRDRQVFRLFGYAGTGKTTLAIEMAKRIGGTVLFAAYTGKAASVMQKAGCIGATTIHSLAYLPRPKGVDNLMALRSALEELQERASNDPSSFLDEDMHRLEEAIAVEEQNLDKPAFTLNGVSPIRYADLLIVDECSMVGEEMAKDLMSFGTPILALGDPAQLPPVRSAGYFTGAPPDVLLTEIHRQALDNPIIRLASQVREGNDIPYGDHGTVKVIRPSDLDRSLWRSNVQVLVGTNKRRNKANSTIRAARERAGNFPVPGDRLVCLRNCRDQGLLNGTLWDVLDCRRDDDFGVLSMDLRSEDGNSELYDVPVWPEPFLGEELPKGFERLGAQEFDYGYALTVHKAQGSQWADVLVVDESSVFRKDRWRWLYTAITRAAETLTIVR